MIEQHERAYAHATNHLHGLILGLVRDVFGEVAIDRRALYDGNRFSEQTATSLEGLWATDWLLKRVSQEVQWHARRAREAGHTWEQIGRALGAASNDDHSVAEAAYERFAGSPACWSLRGPSFAWRCPVCDRVVSDRGPYESHPDDNQPGHAEDCSRFAAELDHWRSSLDGRHATYSRSWSSTTEGRGDRDAGRIHIRRGRYNSC